MKYKGNVDVSMVSLLKRFLDNPIYNVTYGVSIVCNRLSALTNGTRS